jgi:hypothetical protein
MHETVIERSPITPEKAQVILGIEASMNKGLTQEIKAARNQIARMLGLPVPHRALDFSAECRGYLLVGINAQDPVACGPG